MKKLEPGRHKIVAFNLCFQSCVDKDLNPFCVLFRNNNIKAACFLLITCFFLLWVLHQFAHNCMRDVDFSSIPDLYEQLIYITVGRLLWGTCRQTGLLMSLVVFSFSGELITFYIYHVWNYMPYILSINTSEVFCSDVSLWGNREVLAPQKTSDQTLSSPCLRCLLGQTRFPLEASLARTVLEEIADYSHRGEMTKHDPTRQLWKLTFGDDRSNSR